MVIWIIGLSGAGKTTLAKEIVSKSRSSVSNVVLIDGDEIRGVFGNDLSFSIEDRRQNADRICKLCKFLDEQGIHVVCAILSMFEESRSWNRENINDYYEVFVDSPIQELIKRDSKGIYKKFQAGEIKNVAGLDIEFPRPENADLIIQNVDSREKLLQFSGKLSNKIRNAVT
jgi:adenylylsulfate kinase-like enzyme